MFTVYLINGNNETLALDDGLDAPHVAQFMSVGAMLDYVGRSLGATAYRINDDCEAVPHLVAGYEVREDGFDITDQMPAALARRKVSRR